MKKDPSKRLKCRRCLRDFVRPVCSAGSLEKVLTAFSVYPFRCQLCGHRFRAFQRGSGDVLQDRRQYARLKRPMRLTFKHGTGVGEGTVLDISMAGCGFTAAADLPVGTVMRLELQPAGEIPPVAVDAAVVRSVREQITGVEFIRWQETERERLQLFIRGLLIGRAAENEQAVRMA